MKRKWMALAVLVVLLLLPAGIASAQGPVGGSDGGQVFTGQDVSLDPGEVFEGDLSVIDGNLDMAEGSSILGDLFVTKGRAAIAGKVHGNAAIMGGEIDLVDTGQVVGDLFAMGGKHDLAGQVNGNVSILFGETILRSSAVVRGDLLAVPGDLTQEEGAQVKGEVVSSLSLPRAAGTSEPERLPDVPSVAPATPRAPEQVPPVQVQPPSAQSHRFGDRLARFTGRLLAAMFLSLLVMGIGALIVLIWPRSTQRVDDCIAALPGQSLGLGLLTFFLAAALEVVAIFLMVLVILVGALLMATIVLIPVGLLLILLSGLLLLPVPLALAGGFLLGWVALAEIVGRKLLESLRVRDASQLAQVLLGLLVTLVPATVLWLIQPWCCGVPFVVVLTSIGLGAVFHTRFGTRTCQKESPHLEPDMPAPGPASKVDSEEVSAEYDSLPADVMDQEAGLPDAPPPPPPPPPPSDNP